MALRKLMELGNLQDKTTHAVTPSKEGVGGFLTDLTKVTELSVVRPSQVLGVVLRVGRSLEILVGSC